MGPVSRLNLRKLCIQSTGATAAGLIRRRSPRALRVGRSLSRHRESGWFELSGDATLLDGMVFVERRQYWMGSDSHYPEEAPSREVVVDAFWIDQTPVTNRQFSRFVDETRYITNAERAPDPNDYPGIAPEMIRPGSLVFWPSAAVVDLGDPFAWWAFVFGADWRHPRGPASDIADRMDHPVVHVAYADAAAYAAWAGKSLPTEAEWECAARGGLDRAEFAWGAVLEPRGRRMANYWRGRFPFDHADGSEVRGTSPVATYPANGFGLYDMIGNVWEWTQDWFGAAAGGGSKGCCVPRNPRGGEEVGSRDPSAPDLLIGRRVLKGGSHLCAENYCRRYRPSARHPQPIDTSTSHVGFRCVRRQR